MISNSLHSLLRRALPRLIGPLALGVLLSSTPLHAQTPSSWLEATGFARRQAAGHALLTLDQRAVSRRNVLETSELLAAPRIRVVTILGDREIRLLPAGAGQRDEGCQPVILVNGQVLPGRGAQPPRLDAFVSPAAVDAVEVYDAIHSPVADRCGAVLIWAEALEELFAAPFVTGFRIRATLPDGEPATDLTVRIEHGDVVLHADASGSVEAVDLTPGYHRLIFEYPGMPPRGGEVLLRASEIIELEITVGGAVQAAGNASAGDVSSASGPSTR
jgi:hypothetical protein